jgi:hypothetical protein
VKARRLEPVDDVRYQAASRLLVEALPPRMQDLGLLVEAVGAGRPAGPRRTGSRRHHPAAVLAPACARWGALLAGLVGRGAYGDGLRNSLERPEAWQALSIRPFTFSDRLRSMCCET